MLSGTHFYYQTIRKSVIAFGNIFKDIVLVKYSNDLLRNELSRITVPLIYSGKEDYWVRLNQLPELPSSVDVKLPIMAFSLSGLSYDSSRKQQSSLQNLYTASSNTVNTQYVGVPYNLEFELSIFVRNIEDGTQIVEQIIPYFNPDYTLTINYNENMNIIRNIPIVLDSINFENQYEGDSKSTIRSVIWTLKFTLATYFYGPISVGSIIRQANVNMYYFSTPNEDSTIILNTSNTTLGGFVSGEYVYQGSALNFANAVGKVVSWSPKSGILTLTGLTGTFVPNANVTGALSGGSVLVNNVPINGLLSEIIVTPNPINANANSDFGFNIQIVE